MFDSEGVEIEDWNNISLSNFADMKHNEQNWDTFCDRILIQYARSG